MRLIDADALLVALRNYWAEGTNETGMQVLDKIIVSLENKEEDAEPVKHGKWIWEWAYGVYSCSECGFRAFGDSLECADGTFQYCPACGAKMDEVEE